MFLSNLFPFYTLLLPRFLKYVCDYNHAKSCLFGKISFSKFETQGFFHEIALATKEKLETIEQRTLLQMKAALSIL